MNRAGAWWALAEHACGRIAAPKIDVATADRHAEALFRDSWLWSSVKSLDSKVHAAWLDSRCRRYVRRLTSD
jgi:hypothetical protein